MKTGARPTKVAAVLAGKAGDRVSGESMSFTSALTRSRQLAGRRQRHGAALLVVGAIAGAGLGLASTSSADAPQALGSAARLGGATIVEVEGDAANGFSIQRLNGTQEFPPTDSEASAECGEYDRKVRRVRCRTEVRQWYTDLADMRDTITYYQRLFD